MHRKFNVVLLLLAFIALSGVLAVSSRYGREQWDIDYCLDRGGSFDYTSMSCDLLKSHVFSSYRARHPHDAKVVLVGSVLFFVFSAAYFYVRRPRKIA